MYGIFQNESIQREITDLQSEFEFDRIDYLDTIRALERQQELSQALLDRIHPCLRRDCNYSNLDRYIHFNMVCILFFIILFCYSEITV